MKFLSNGEMLRFEGFRNKDIYNPTEAFDYAGEKILVARVESRHSELDSKAVFFRERDGGLWLKTQFPSFNMQDPFITKIGDEYILGGVEVRPIKKGIDYWTVMYKGGDLDNLGLFFRGPKAMKDIRIVEISKNRIGVFTRPQSGIYGKGRICYTEISSLDELTHKVVDSAKIIDDSLGSDCWRGVNAAYPVGDRVGVLGHLAFYADTKKVSTCKAKKSLDNLLDILSETDTDGYPGQPKHYYAWTFMFNPSNRRISKSKILARRDDFPKGPAKRNPELYDVIFPGGLEFKGNDVVLYAGLSDSSVGRKIVSNPFL